MIRFEVSTIVAATPRAVFDFLIEVDNMPKWRSEVRSVWLVEGDDGVVDALYAVVVREPGTELDLPVPIRLAAVERDERIDLELRSGLVTLGSSFRLSPVPEGTELVVGSTFDGPLPLARRMANGELGRIVEQVWAITRELE